jgi:hypothetical protein
MAGEPDYVLGAPQDQTSSLAHGGLIQASVRARVAGIPLLRIEASVALAPAAITEVKPFSSGRAKSKRRVGRGLAEAVRNLNEGAELLAQTRRNGS